MEIDLLALVQEDGFRIVSRCRSRGMQYNGPCPFDGCGGTDRFRVQPNHGEYGWFACNQCGRKGSSIDYLILKRGMSKMEALIMVGWKPRDGSTPHLRIPTSAHQEQPRWEAPPGQWQEAALEFIWHCERTLWHDTGKEALAYLRGRGLSDEIIQAARLGYHRSEEMGIQSQWGRWVKLPQGIVIPWLYQRQVWRLTIRDLRVEQGNGRYTQVAGGSNGLYLANTLSWQAPAVVLVEGEIDALSVIQACERRFAVVATGTTSGSHTPYWIDQLARQPRVLVAFDAEDAADTAARWWTTRLKNAQRLRPWAHKDANQMLQAGIDLSQWIESALASKDLSQALRSGGLSQTASPTSPEAGMKAIPVCWNCKQPADHPNLTFFFSDTGICYCSRDIPPSVVQQIGREEANGPHELIEEVEVPIAHGYVPCDLPPLPREQCPHRFKAKGDPIPGPCQEPPLANGWCVYHQRSQEFLNLGAQYGYPHAKLYLYTPIWWGIYNWEHWATRLRQREWPAIERVRKQITPGSGWIARY